MGASDALIKGAGEAGLARGTPSGLEYCWRWVAGRDKVAAGRSPSAPATLVLILGPHDLGPQASPSRT